ncbi:MAG: hypothetical protein ACLFSA_11205 [Spirochaetaceae bacterium]
MNGEDDEIVYSSEAGDLRKSGRRKKDSGRNRSSGGIHPDADGAAKVRREKKGRGGKTVTAVYGIPLAGDELKELEKKLKQSCGSGGSVKGGVIEIQGDEVDKVIDLLKKEGFSAKKAGG